MKETEVTPVPAKPRGRPRKVVAPATPVEKVLSVAKEQSVGLSDLANALVAAINQAKPKEKKNPFNRTVSTPWTPKDGSPRLKLKRKAFQHGMEVDGKKLSNEEVALYNKLRPGRFLGGLVQVKRRRDRGIDIDYPIKTASQRLKLVNQFGIRNLSELLALCIHEADNPKPQLEDLD